MSRFEVGPAQDAQHQHDAVAIGIDLGGTTFKLAATDGTTLGPITSGPTGFGRSPDAVVDEISAAVRAVAESHADRSRIVGVGIGAPGHVEPDAGVLRSSQNLGWPDVELTHMIEERTGLACVLEHDGYVGALAEHGRGSANRGDHLLYVSIGTGLSCALLSPAGAWRGGTRFAGEIGLGLLGDGRRVEDVISGPALSRSYAQRTGLDASADQIAATTKTDADARACWSEFVATLADVLWNTIVVTDPGVVVIGGGLSLAGRALLGPLDRELNARAMAVRPLPPIRAAAHGRHGGCLGAGLHALQELGKSWRPGDDA